MKILDRKDAMNRRQDKRLIIVETVIYRVSCFNRTVLLPLPSARHETSWHLSGKG
ncbi:hypothetical protein [Nostoc sp.]|uniref:hypothetical protein n=1 Tax=Nostoc sp. TaxID=1180 RepID=UPI002FF95A69